jgi:hypothetical protein
MITFTQELVKIAKVKIDYHESFCDEEDSYHEGAASVWKEVLELAQEDVDYEKTKYNKDK